MTLIKVQYDAYNRQFKLLDRDLAHTMADGETYLLIVDLSVDGPEGVDNNAEMEYVMAEAAAASR